MKEERTLDGIILPPNFKHFRNNQTYLVNFAIALSITSKNKDILNEQ